MNVLVLGDACLDDTRSTRFSRRSPENAACPVLTEPLREWNLGGAANVARWLAADSRLSVTLAAPRGRGDQGNLLRSLCHEAGIHLAGNLYNPGWRVSVKERIVVEDAETGHAYPLARIDEDSLGEIGPADLTHLASLFRSGRWEAIVCVDYDKRVFRGTTGAFLLREIERLPIPVYVNSKRPDRWRSTHIDVLVCNEQELQDGLKLSARKAWEAICATCLVVTQGREGVTAVLEKATLNERTQAQEVVDVCGAGDAFLAGFVRADLCTRDRAWDRYAPNRVVDLLDMGQRCAAWCCGQVGVGVPLVTGEAHE